MISQDLQIILSDGALTPVRAYEDSIGLDIHAFLLSERGQASKSLIPPNTTRLIPTGVRVRPPPGHAVLVCSRSGLAKDSIFVANAPGVIDPDYTGEIFVALYNGSHISWYIHHQMRIAQLIVLPIPLVRVVKVEEFPESERGERGFGSTEIGRAHV